MSGTVRSHKESWQQSRNSKIKSWNSAYDHHTYKCSTYFEATSSYRNSQNSVTNFCLPPQNGKVTKTGRRMET